MKNQHQPVHASVSHQIRILHPCSRFWNSTDILPAGVIFALAGLSDDDWMKVGASDNVDANTLHFAHSEMSWFKMTTGLNIVDMSTHSSW